MGEQAGLIRERALSALQSIESPRAAVVTEAWELARSDEGREHLECFLEAHSSHHVMFPGGTKGLGCALAQLIRNAGEGDGSARASSVTLSVFCEHNGNCILLVEDDGPGADPELLPHLGRERRTSQKPGSTGLGLWLVQLMASSVGGRFGAENRASQVEFSVRLELPTA